MKKVLVGGCFDIIHYGHIHFLKNSKSFGDRLIVALESDENIKRMKGKSRPFHTQEQRKEMLLSLSFVDEVIILSDEMKDTDYQKLVIGVSPQVIAVTEGDPVLEKKKVHAVKVNAKVRIIPKFDNPSTSAVAKLLDLEK